MPARGRANLESIPADVLMDLSRDTKKFEKRLQEYVDRKVAAEAAEIKNQNIEVAANDALAELGKRQREHEGKAKEDRQSLEQDRAELTRAQGRLAESIAAVEAQSRELKEQIEQVELKSRDLDKRKEQLDEQSIEQQRTERQLDSREGQLDAKEDELKSRAEALEEWRCDVESRLADLPKL